MLLSSCARARARSRATPGAGVAVCADASVVASNHAASRIHRDGPRILIRVIRAPRAIGCLRSAGRDPAGGGATAIYRAFPFDTSALPVDPPNELARRQVWAVN